MGVRRKSLSTGDIARHCQVTPATVVNWIKAGKLKVYTTPGGQYRMEIEEFLKFLGANGFPVPDELVPARERRVLVVDDDPEILDKLTEGLGALLPNVLIEDTGDGYDALVKIGSFQPHVIVLDLMMARLDGAEVCRLLRTNAQTRNTFIVATIGTPANVDLLRRVKRIGVDTLMNKPIDIGQLAITVGKLLQIPVPV